MKSTINKTFVQYLQQIHLHYTHTGGKEVTWRTGLSFELAVAPKRRDVLTQQGHGEKCRDEWKQILKRRHVDNIKLSQCVVIGITWYLVAQSVILNNTNYRCIHIHNLKMYQHLTENIKLIYSKDYWHTSFMCIKI